MSIRFKIFFCLAGVAAAVWLGMASMVSKNYLHRFDEIDRKQLNGTVNNVLQGIREDNRHLQIALDQWAGSAKDPENAQVRSQAAEFLDSYHLDLLVKIGNAGEVAGVFDKGGSRASLSPGDAAALASMVAGSLRGEGRSGILSLTRGPFLAVAAPAGEGAGGMGVVGGAFLDEEYEQYLRNKMLTDIQFLAPTGDVLNQLQGAGSSAVWLPDLGPDSNQNEAFALLRDFSGEPALILKLTDSRHSLLQARANLRFFLGVSGASTILVVLIGTFLVEYLVVGRIRRLTVSARRADVNGMEDLPSHVAQSRDEIGVLTRSMKSMVENLKSAQLLYRAIVETQSELIVRFKPDGEITLVNEAFARFFERNPRAIVGRDLREFFQTSAMNGTDILTLRPDANSRSSSQEFEFQRGGKCCWLRWNQKALLDGERNVEEIQAVGEDITLQREYQLKLENAKNAAEAADRSKGEFLAIMSHESRTPLTSILGFASLMEKTPLNDQQIEYIKLIQASGESLLMLLNDVLDYSNVASGRISLNPVTLDLPALARELIATHSPEARHKDLEIDVEIMPDSPTWIEADAGRLKQIMHNLLTNAIKFTERGFVHLRIACGEEGFVEFSVQDTGIGIPKDKFEQIFMAFGMTDSSNTRGYGGAGIGLAVSRKLARLMGGSISVRSEQGLGSRFSVVLPIGKPVLMPVEAASSPASHGGDPQLASPHLSDLRALVVDDNRVNRLVICRMLQMLGLKFEAVDGGAAALEMIAREKFDVVFMDIQMPDMDGFETTQHIRERETQGADTKAAYIIACTAFDLPGDREKCLAAGMDDFVPKPVRMEELRRALSAVPYQEPRLSSRVNV